MDKLGHFNLAFIYGSFASQNAGLNSDIDVLIAGDINEEVIITELNALEKKLSREINYIILRYTEFQEKIENKDPFIMEILHEPKIMIIGEWDVK